MSRLSTSAKTSLGSGCTTDLPEIPPRRVPTVAALIVYSFHASEMLYTPRYLIQDSYNENIRIVENGTCFPEGFNAVANFIALRIDKSLRCIHKVLRNAITSCFQFVTGCRYS